MFTLAVILMLPGALKFHLPQYYFVIAKNIAAMLCSVVKCVSFLRIHGTNGKCVLLGPLRIGRRDILPINFQHSIDMD